MGIEPTFSAWEADVLPLNYTRLIYPCLQSDAPVAYRSHSRFWNWLTVFVLYFGIVIHLRPCSLGDFLILV